MKKIILFTVLIMIIPIVVVYQAFGSGQVGTPTTNTSEAQANGNFFACGDGPSRTETLSQSEYSSLRKLGEVEASCGTVAAKNLMIFTSMPKDTPSAKKMAGEMKNQLLNFQKNGVKPIVVVEPDSAWGLVDFTEFNTGFWNPWIKAYFDELKALGVTDEMMGTWVPFPEANLPLWNHQNARPSDFSKAVNRYLRTIKIVFPEANGGVLLNSATYETDDFDWSDGYYISLAPFVDGLDGSLVDTFGIQGFPWMPSAGEAGREIFDGREFINNPLAIEAAEKIGTKNIWINTGTFATKYAGASAEQVFMPAQKRQEILNTILGEAVVIKESGYNVTINIFAEDKSSTPEATDWSYWASDYTNSEHLSVLKSFLNKLRESKIESSFFLR